jgi:hypothetical protein
MAAPESTKFQVNYKLADGTLINIYATNQTELESSLTSLSDLSTLITTTGTTLGATPQSFNGAGAISYAKKALGATSVATDTGGDTVTDKNGTVWTYNRADAPDCINGKMVFAAGTSQKGKPYKGWFDPMKGPKPMRKPEGYVPVDPIFLK